MIILGLNAFGHDAAAVLLVDGKPAYAASQERLDRRRHSAAWPAEAIEAALSAAGVAAHDVDAVAFPWSRGMARARKALHVLKRLPRSRAFLRRPMDDGLPGRRGYLKAMREVEQHVRTAGLQAPVQRVAHHRAHAASAALALPGGRGAVLTADGMGEWTTAATWSCEQHHVRRLQRAVYPHSPGKVYAAVTQWLGFRPESDEGKTMGLAAYGDAASERARAALDLLFYDPQHLCRVPQDLFGFPWGEAALYGPAFVERFGPPGGGGGDPRPEDADVALGIQTALDAWTAAAAGALLRETGAQDLALAGGIFLNCATNGRLRRLLLPHGVRVHPFPVAGDAGAAWGAAAEVHRTLTGEAAAPLDTLYLGHDIDASEAAAQARALGMRQAGDTATLAAGVAGRIAAGQILAVARGRAEFGPRALGHRSVLASPCSRASRDRVNALKGREAWRPLAPIVRREDTRWFEDLGDSAYMILTFHAAERAQREIPGVVHADGTARVQTVAADGDPFLRALLDALEARGHPPVVINTSLNRRGEPIVDTAAQARAAAQAMGLDGLVLGDWISEGPL